MINLIGISGKKQSGKNTVAGLINYLIYKERVEKVNATMYLKREEFLENQTHYMDAFKRNSFALPLKELISNLIGCNIKDLEKESFKNTHLPKEWNINEVNDKNNPTSIRCKYYTVRGLMVEIGSKLRSIHPDIFINATFKNFDKNQYKIITDVRFENEAISIKKKGGVLIRINKKDYITDNNASETELDNSNLFDFIINNNGTIDDLEAQIKEILIKLKLISQ